MLQKAFEVKKEWDLKEPISCDHNLSALLVFHITNPMQWRAVVK
jgi:hypothetical protein